MASWWVSADEFRKSIDDINLRLGRIEASLARIEKTCLALFNQWSKIMPTIDDIQTKVGELTTVEDSVVALLDNIKQMLNDARGDPAKIQAVITQLDARKQALADAVARNTDAG